MSGSTNTALPINTHIDYREAFVLDMELVAHGPSCKQCMTAALNGKLDDQCDRMKYMREYIKKAYEALPLYYKKRYEEALEVAFNVNRAAVRDAGGLG